MSTGAGAGAGDLSITGDVEEGEVLTGAGAGTVLAPYQLLVRVPAWEIQAQ